MLPNWLSLFYCRTGWCKTFRLKKCDVAWLELNISKDVVKVIDTDLQARWFGRYRLDLTHDIIWCLRGRLTSAAMRWRRICSPASSAEMCESQIGLLGNGSCMISRLDAFKFEVMEEVSTREGMKKVSAYLRFQQRLSDTAEWKSTRTHAATHTSSSSLVKAIMIQVNSIRILLRQKRRWLHRNVFAKQVCHICIWSEPQILHELWLVTQIICSV